MMYKDNNEDAETENIFLNYRIDKEINRMLFMINSIIINIKIYKKTNHNDDEREKNISAMDLKCVHYLIFLSKTNK